MIQNLYQEHDHLLNIEIDYLMLIELYQEGLHYFHSHYCHYSHIGFLRILIGGHCCDVVASQQFSIHFTHYMQHLAVFAKKVKKMLAIYIIMCARCLWWLACYFWQSHVPIQHTMRPPVIPMRPMASASVLTTTSNRRKH